jgi:hypothetical protein
MPTFDEYMITTVSKQLHVLARQTSLAAINLDPSTIHAWQHAWTRSS